MYLECKEPRGSEVYKYWRVDPGQGRVDCVIFREIARRKKDCYLFGLVTAAIKEQRDGRH